MSLTHLEINSFRNLSHFTFSPSPGFNFFYGENGTGKTSLLEAIFHLSAGRSFRTHLYREVIQNGEDSFRVVGKVNDKFLGIERYRSGDLTVKFDQEEVKSVSRLAEVLPVQLIDPNTHLLVTGGPRNRRQFMDWGAFHSDETFLKYWKRLNRALKQRNAALKQKSDDAKIWHKELVESSQYIDFIRKNYINRFIDRFNLLQKEQDFPTIFVGYYSGWDNEFSYEEVLENSFQRDMHYGITHYGPHRADLRITLDDNHSAAEHLSRGQQKRVVSTMKIAQAMLLNDENHKKSLFLVDDLPSELDESNKQFIMNNLREMNCQVFITGVEQTALEKLADKDSSITGLN